MRQVDAIYLNKRGYNSDTSKWAYYRVSSTGNIGDQIEMCLVSWPSFEDIDEVLSEHAAVVVNPGETGFVSAYPNILKVLKSKWWRRLPPSRHVEHRSQGQRLDRRTGSKGRKPS